MTGVSLSIKNISHDYGDMRALDDVSLEMAPGELIALLGPSGCGKTTLLRAIAGFLNPTAGDILIDGKRVNSLPASRRNIGIVFQNYALFPHMAVADNVAYGLRCRSVPRTTTAARVEEMLSLTQMEAFRHRYPKELSGGQQQRVALARALAVEPQVVLLDEPFSALDKNLRLDMQIEVKSLLKAQGLTAIIVTHDQEEALSMADRIVVLNNGGVEQIDAPEALYDRPKSLFVNSFVGQVNLLPGTVTGQGIRLGDGTDVPLSGLSFRHGTDVVLSIRPENLSLAAPGTDGTLPAKARLTLPLGSVEVIEARRPDGVSVKVVRHRTAGAAPLKNGEDVGLAITDMDAVSVFSAPNPQGSTPSSR